jgi:hypothetical protein
MMFDPLPNSEVAKFRGDGYTKSERKKFYDDVQRMTEDLFQGETFKSILPVYTLQSMLIVDFKCMGSLHTVRRFRNWNQWKTKRYCLWIIQRWN